MEVLSSNPSNLILTLLICSITDIIWDFISSLSAADIWTWRCPTRKLLLLWTRYAKELNAIDLASIIIIYRVISSPAYVHLCKCLIKCEIKKEREKKRERKKGREREKGRKKERKIEDCQFTSVLNLEAHCYSTLFKDLMYVSAECGLKLYPIGPGQLCYSWFIYLGISDLNVR